MNEESSMDQEDKLKLVLEKMSREEIIQALKESIKHIEEQESGSKLLATHLKVFCYKNGGTITYTKEEFDAAAKQDHEFSVDYGADNGKEVCILKLTHRPKIDDSVTS